MSMERIVANLMPVAVDAAPGLEVSTAIPRLTIWSSSRPTRPTPAMFEPKFYILLQGAKRLTIGGEAHDFGVGSCAVASVGLPFTSEVLIASPDAPYLGLELRLDPGMVASLLLDTSVSDDGEAPTFTAGCASPDVLEPLERLVRLLATPAEIPVLALHLERELCFRLLQGPMGGTLCQIVQHNSCFRQIRTALEWIRGNASHPMRVPQLAASVGMSATSFHRHFKAVTACSPLAYQRHIRLLEARRLVASGATNVTSAAFATGYASSSQFSREYKRMFGVSPVKDVPALH